MSEKVHLLLLFCCLPLFTLLARSTLEVERLHRQMKTCLFFCEKINMLSIQINMFQKKSVDYQYIFWVSFSHNFNRKFQIVAKASCFYLKRQVQNIKIKMCNKFTSNSLPLLHDHYERSWVENWPSIQHELAFVSANEFLLLKVWRKSHCQKSDQSCNARFIQTSLTLTVAHF